MLELIGVIGGGLRELIPRADRLIIKWNGGRHFRHLYLKSGQSAPADHWYKQLDFILNDRHRSRRASTSRFLTVEVIDARGLKYPSTKFQLGDTVRH